MQQRASIHVVLRVAVPSSGRRAPRGGGSTREADALRLLIPALTEVDRVAVLLK